jgi:hypothetical protein
VVERMRELNENKGKEEGCTRAQSGKENKNKQLRVVHYLSEAHGRVFLKVQQVKEKMAEVVVKRSDLRS